MDSFSIFLMVIFAAGLYIFSGRFSSTFPPAIIITLLLILFVQMRALVLIVIPDSLLHSSRITSEMFNVTLGYMLFGMLMCYLGLAWGYGSKGGPDQNTIALNFTKDAFGIKFSAIIFIIMLSLTMLVYYGFGYAGATGSGEHLGFFQRYVARLIFPVGWLMMFLSAYALYSGKNGYSRLFWSVFFLYFISFVLMGSRGGLYEIAILLLSYKIIFRGNFEFKLNGQRILALVGLIPFALFIYRVSSQLRVLWYGGDLSVASVIWLGIESGINFTEISPFLSEVSYRLSFFEPTMFPIFFDELGLNEVSGLVNIGTTFFSSLNRLIPGKPFGEILFTEYAFGFFYDPQGILAYSESGRVDYTGYEWSMFGISYQLFGFLGGGLFILAFTALIARFIRIFNSLGGFYGLTCSIFAMGVLSVWIRNLGIDNLIDRSVHGLVVLGLYMVLFWGVMKFRGPYYSKLCRIKS